ncbi:MAG TPA: hypothetical protein VJT54_10050 [Verrucomicrobiae bacterium]|nr:hypothetical protein [Verrucomicrobiae bacterium]
MKKINSAPKRFTAFHLGMVLTTMVAAFVAQAQTTATLTIQANQPGAPISSNLFGIFFEEINSAGDGGIYAEMVRNRSFEEPGNTNYWQLITSGSGLGTISPDSSLPLSASNLFSLKLTQSSASGSAGVANGGYWGMNFRPARLAIWASMRGVRVVLPVRLPPVCRVPMAARRTRRERSAT